MHNQDHCMSIKQANLIVNAHIHNLLNSLCNNWYVYVKQYENKPKTTGLGNEVLDSFKY